MNLVKAKCPTCGGELDVNPESECLICKYCGSPFIVEKAINNFNTNVQNQTINNSGTINVENVHIHGAGEIDEKNAFDLGVQSLQGGNASEAFKYFTKVVERNPNNYIATLYRGASAAYMSQILANGMNLRLLEMDASFDRVFKDESFREKINQEEINSAYTMALNVIHDICKRALDLYQPGYRYMDNVNMLWGTLEQCFNSLTVIGSYVPVAFTNEDDKTQIEIIKTTASLTSIILAQLLEPRVYSVDWGPRSGLGQMNTVKHPRYSELAQIKKEFDETAKKDVPGFVPEHTVPTKSTNNNGCYVATCVYGSYDCPQVWVLRRYRDYYLDERWWGRLFIKIYYTISPTIVKIFGNVKLFRKINKSILDRKINKLYKKGYEDTQYFDKY